MSTKPQYTYKAGDRRPPIEARLETNSGPEDLTQATVTVRIVRRGGGVDATSASVNVKDQAQFPGEVQFYPTTQFSMPGHYDVYFKADYGSGNVKSFPRPSYIYVLVEPSF